MEAVLVFLLLVPGGIVADALIKNKIDDCWERGESFCEYRMKPFNSLKRKRYLESLDGGIDYKLECEVWTKYDPEYAKTLKQCKPEERKV